MKFRLLRRPKPVRGTARLGGSVVVAMLWCGVGHAETVWLSCNASGAAGSVSFNFSFDDANNQAATHWISGGGRPHASLAGESGTDDSDNVNINAGMINAGFVYTPYDDPRAYRVRINRTDGSLEFMRYNGGLHSSFGSCTRMQAPTRF